jgi:hypothetical protein
MFFGWYFHEIILKKYFLFFVHLCLMKGSLRPRICPNVGWPDAAERVRACQPNKSRIFKTKTKLGESELEHTGDT